MFRHNFMIRLHGFMRNKTTFVNLTGLSTGVAAVLLIFLWVLDETKIDHFDENGERLYQVMHNLEMSQGFLTTEISPVPFGAKYG